MRRLLIVSPHFPPVNAPDMQRVRMALPHLRRLGWDPVVLALHPESVEGAVSDPLFERSYPEDIRVVRVRGISPRITRRLGFGSVWLRCGRALRRAGDALLAAERFDLAFFSTTQFRAFLLGPRWKRHFGVPYVLDYQDPWVSDYYELSGVPPPGGRLRYHLARRAALRLEPEVVRHAAGLVSVSPKYLEDIRRRYPGTAGSRPGLVLPFGASQEDIELARTHRPESPVVRFGTAGLHVVSTGRGGGDMARAARILFSAVKSLRDANDPVASRLSFHFVGTDYAPAPLARPSIQPLATELGVGEMVFEHCHRVPYFDALSYQASSDAILVLGSDDPSYTASKLRPCLLARRPVLCIAHRDSPLYASAASHLPESTFGFGSEDPDSACVERLQTWLKTTPWTPPRLTPDDEAAISAEGATSRLARFFEEVSSPSPNPS